MKLHCGLRVAGASLREHLLVAKVSLNGAWYERGNGIQQAWAGGTMAEGVGLFLLLFSGAGRK